MNEILKRYILYNAHAASYTWKYNGKNLKMDATLAENQIRDEDEQFYELGMNDDQYLQAIHLYFNDDLTEAWWSSSWCLARSLSSASSNKRDTA